MKVIPSLFAEIKSFAEDLHVVAIEGQRLDNAPDMQRVLTSQLRMTMAAMRGKVGEIKCLLGDAHD